MANSLTNQGQWMALGATNTGNVAGSKAETGMNTAGLVLAATTLSLFTNATTPNKDGTGFTAATGTGSGAKTISDANWTGSIPTVDAQVVLADQTWTAGAGGIANIAGAYILQLTNTVELGWWERSSAVSLLDTDQLTADDLTIRLT